MTLSRTEKAALWRNRHEVFTSTVNAVALAYGLKPEDILGTGRAVPLSSARHEVMARLWEMGMSQVLIGLLMRRNASSVNAGVRKALGEEEYARLTPGQGGRNI